MNKNYQRGTRFERELVNAIKAAGGLATRSAGSHGKWDVAALVDSVMTHVKVSKLFDWATPLPKDPFFDWTATWTRGRLEKTVWIKVVREGNVWVYFIQAKVHQ